MVYDRGMLNRLTGDAADALEELDRALGRLRSAGVIVHDADDVRDIAPSDFEPSRELSEELAELADALRDASDGLGEAVRTLRRLVGRLAKKLEVVADELARDLEDDEGEGDPCAR